MKSILPGNEKDYKLIWNDEFTGDSLDRSKWRIETLHPDWQGNMGQASQHLTSNVFGIDRDGNVRDGVPALGKRHSMWYDDHHDKTIKVDERGLVLGGYHSEEDDPTIKAPWHPYVHPRNGKTADFSKKRFAPWLDTYATSWHEGKLRPARHPSVPNFYFRYGYLEVAIDFSEVIASGTEAYRVSTWLLPAVDPRNPDVSLIGTTYNLKSSDGFETDLFEFVSNEPNLLLMKNIGGSRWLPATDVSKFGIDLRTGVHQLGVLWHPTQGFKFFVDGIQVAHDPDLCDVAMAIYLTREGCSSVRDPGSRDGAQAVPPFRQRDEGLFAGNVGTVPRERLHKDKAIIKSVRVIMLSREIHSWRLSCHYKFYLERFRKTIIGAEAAKNTRY